MTTKKLSRSLAKQAVDTLQKFVDKKFANHGRGISPFTEASRKMGIPRTTLHARIEIAEREYGLKIKQPVAKPVEPDEPPPFAIQHDTLPIGTSTNAKWEFTSLPDNTFRFAAFGDLHAASKYTRWDVREDLTKRAEDFKAQAILDTGNWIDGEKSFNRYDLEAVGLDAQCALLAQRYPKSKLTTYAVAGADHEGWYVKTLGVDVGAYCEDVMNDYGHKWVDLGYMEADIVLKNYNTGKKNILRIAHPGGGTGYALSYRPQKIIESYEGGEKPAVLLLGHYHKIDFGLVRNVWYVQTGCSQDQTPFMRQKSIEAHVGGFFIEMEQDPRTGAIISFTPQARRYFNRAYYFEAGSANNRWNGSGPIKKAPRSIRHK